MIILDDLIAQVHATTDAEASALALIDDLAKRLDTLTIRSDMPALFQLVGQLKAQRERLAAAILANTPAAPAMPPGLDAQGEPAPSSTPVFEESDVRPLPSSDRGAPKPGEAPGDPPETGEPPKA